MKNNTITWLAFFIVAISSAAFVYYYIAQSTTLFSGGEGIPSGNKNVVLPKATGNITDAVNAILQSADLEGAAVLSSSNEKALITADSQEVSGFSQSANENGF